MNNGKLTTLAATAALSLFACDARTLIGDVPDGSAPNDSGPGPIEAGPDLAGTRLPGDGGTCSPASEQPFTTPASLTGVWTGYVSGGVGLASDAIKLVLDQAPDGSDRIQVVFGTAAPPAPATSATELYPPGYAYMQVALMSLFEGYTYTAHNVKWQAFGQQWRLTFAISSYAGWDSWCRLQTSFPVDMQGTYNCVPGTATTFKYPGMPNEECYVVNGSGVSVQLPCGQVHLCDRTHCACDACGCAGPTTSDGGFDLLFDATSAIGGNVHLIRSTN